MYAKDRDLLIMEPLLFRDLGWAGQTLVSGVASISGTSLELLGDRGLDTQGVGAGYVVTVDGVSSEIVSLLGATEAVVSVPRASTADPAAAPTPASDRPGYVCTFRPQIAWAHRSVLRLAGVHAAGEAPAGEADEADETAILNGAELCRLEVLIALAVIYAAAGAGSAEASAHNQRAAAYLRRAQAERSRLRVHLDLNGDGVAEVVRALGGGQLARG
ncbi:MAG: hypothetical protein SFY69_06130 [Planctomycetota bacterium]|nr:hypothetical protein [Planctomycetota bacterium]